MASLHASGSMRMGRAAQHGTAALRVKPFSATRVPSRAQGIRTRAAEGDAGEAVVLETAAVEVAPMEDDFAFNYNDAVKGNDYNASDVDMALAFYGGHGPSPASNDDHIVNLLGDEDASYFDDIDNNEAWEENEFQVAGIPEAAPKTKGRGKRQDGAEEEEGDETIAKGKALDKFKAMEDAMVLEAAMEEEYGTESRKGESEAEAIAAGQQGVWDWLVDADAGVEDLASSKLSSMRRSTVQLPSDYEVLSGFSTLKVDELDEQTRDMLELIIGDEVTEDELKTVDADVTMDTPASEALTGAEADALDALANSVSVAVDSLEIEELEFRAPVAANAADDVGLAKADVDAYIASLSAAAGAASEMGVDQVKEMFAADGEAVEVDAEAELADDAEIAALLSKSEPSIPGEETLDMVMVDSLLISAEEEADYEVKDIKTELRTLAALDDFSEDDMPDDEQLAILDSYVATAEAFLREESARKESAERMVRDGELPADVFAEELEELPDMERDYAEEYAAEMAAQGDDDEAFAAYEDEADRENWQERILELNRVTKVTKGGKIMGFRCTAIVGNGAGLIGVGCQAGRDVAVAAKRALVDARRNIVMVPLVGAGTIPHKMEAKYHAARVILVPASDGTGVIAGSSIKSVLELAGVQNVLAKRIGCRSALNNARATVKALSQLRSLNDVARARGVPMDRLLLPRKN